MLRLSEEHVSQTAVTRTPSPTSHYRQTIVRLPLPHNECVPSSHFIFNTPKEPPKTLIVSLHVYLGGVARSIRRCRWPNIPHQTFVVHRIRRQGLLTQILFSPAPPPALFLMACRSTCDSSLPPLFLELSVVLWQSIGRRRIRTDALVFGVCSSQLWVGSQIFVERDRTYVIDTVQLDVAPPMMPVGASAPRVIVISAQCAKFASESSDHGPGLCVGFVKALR